MLTVNSFIRLPDGSFVHVDSYGDRPADPDYVEGAIEIVADGVEIVGQREWDYVDQLWSYLADALERFRADGAASTYYPDQPIRIEFSAQGSRVLISSTGGEHVRRVSVNRTEFEEVFNAAGRRFFDRISEIVPVNSDGYAAARSKLVTG